MLKGFAKDFLSLSNLWAITQYFFPAATAAVSVWLSYIWKLPPSLTLCLAVLTAAGVFVFITTLRQNSIVDKLTFDDLRFVNWQVDRRTNRGFVIARFILRNNHPYETIYCVVDVLNYTLDGRTHIGEPVKHYSAHLIAPLSSHKFLLPAIENLPAVGEFNGDLFIRLQYGKTADKTNILREIRFKLEALTKIENGTPNQRLTWKVSQ